MFKIAALTLEEAKARYRMWLDAEEAIAVSGQSYELEDGRKLTRANLKEVKERLNYWDGKVTELEGGTQRNFRGVPLDL